MSDSISTVDDLSMDVINESVLMELGELENESQLTNRPVVLDSRRRLERCLEDRQLEKDLREFDFDI